MRTVALLLALALTGCAAPLQRFEFMRLCMGVQTRIVAYAPSKTTAESAAASAYDRINALDAVMSDYRRQSDLKTLLDAAGGPPIPVSPEFYDILATSQLINEASNGAFDITVAPAVQLWRASRQSGHLPDPQALQAALALIGPEHLILNARLRTAQLTPKGARIDLGGIGKGYAVDRGIAILQAKGVSHALITAGGDSRIIGDRFGKPWIVGIRHPDDKARVIAKIPLVDTAMSTSGDYERYFDEDGVRYHHIIDPRTGKSASKVRSATILASTATRTDGLSKTAFVLGAEAAMKIYERLDDVDAILVTPEGRVLYSKGLEPAAPPPSVPAP
jgi:FAD:protein FMN transferase